MLQENLLKKFSIGLSLNISIQEYEKLILKFGKYISSIYFSLPLGKEFHTRIGVVEEYSQDNAEEKLISILQLFKRNGIKLEVVINQYNLSKEKLIRALEYLKNGIKIDTICTLDEYVGIIRSYYPQIYLVSSFNNLKRNYKDLELTNKEYNQLVIGKNFMRDIKAMHIIKEMGYEIKLLLNNGCSFNCFSCRKSYECQNIFYENLKHCTINELYALQSFLPVELEYLNDKIGIEEIGEFKISNRPCTLEYLSNCLESYLRINNEKYYIEKSIKNYHLWCRLSNFTKFYQELNLDEIIQIKKELWKLPIK